MRILAVDHNAILSSDRGLYRALHDKPEISLTLVVPSRWKDSYGMVLWEPEEGSLPVLASPTLFHGRTHRAIYLSLGKILKKVQPDVLLVNSEPEGYLAWQAVTLRDRFCTSSKVVFFSWRNVVYLRGKFPYKLSWINALAERAVLARADHCVACNDSAKEILGQMGFENVTVIPPAVDTNVFRRRDGTRIRKQLGLKHFTAGYIGRFFQLKGVDTLLRAVESLPFACQILLVGDGPAKSEWMKLAEELHLKDRIVWVGGVRHDEVPAYLNAIDVLVLPSRTGTFWKEQFGRILIEAMACEVPVVGSSSGEIPNVIGNSGLIFIEGNADDLREKIISLYESPDRRNTFAADGLKRVKENFSVSVVAEMYYNLFRELCSDSPG